MTVGRCDISGCDQPASAAVEAGDWLSIGPRDTTGSQVPLCAEHAAAVTERLSLELRSAKERRDPNRNPTNRAAASEDLGDAEAKDGTRGDN